MADYAHLHNHTSASLFDGAQTSEDFAEKIDHLEMEGAAVTDHGVLYAWPEFQAEFEKRNLKPVLGCEAHMVENFNRVQDIRSGDKKPADVDVNEKRFRYHQVLLAKNQTGMKNLMHLMSWAGDEGFYHKPTIDFRRMEKYSEGLIATSSCIQGVIPQALLGNGLFENLTQYERAVKACDLLEQYKDIFGDDFYLEAHRHGMEEEEQVAEGIEWLAGRYDIEVVTANDCHYTNENDFWVQDVRTCISTSDPGNPSIYDNPDRTQYAHENLYVKSGEEMIDLFPEFPDAAENTMKVFEKCNARLPLDEGEYFFPEFPGLNENESAHERLKRECGRRFVEKYPNYTEAHQERMRYELNVIKDMGFSDYFLIVADMVRAARNKNVEVGPGRGSAASSMVTYVLGITGIDPMQYNLLFDRFLNKERVTMPDIDIDFDDERRERVFEYIYNKYGEDRVAKTITFTTFKTKNTIKDVGKIFRMESSELNAITKKIPKDLQSAPISEILDSVEEIHEISQEDERFRKTCEAVSEIRGLKSHTGMHAAAAVITPGPLNDYLPTERDRNSGEIKTQFDGDQLEEIGLLKMDVLGLKTLREIRMAVDLVKERSDTDFDESVLDERDDPDVYENIFAEGNTRGVFQYHKSGMRHYLSQMKPFKFEHLIAMNALYRPGPMKLIPNFIRRMHGEEKPEYFHPDAKPYLEETYGIMVYQEQIMQVARELAGFTLGEADILRRAIGKKKTKLLMDQKEKFVQGCLDQGNSKEKAEEVFDLIEEFADYGFNKAHATAYAALGYRQAYLKHHFPTEFFTSVIETEENEERRAALIQNAGDEGVDVLQPNINKSHGQFKPEGENIRYGLEAVKHVGKEAHSILKEREENGKYGSFIELAERAIPNLGAVRALIKAGAMDCFDMNRATMYENMEDILEYARKLRDYRKDKRKSKPTPPPVNEVEEWPSSMKFQQEREVTGTYVSGTPIDGYRLIADSFHGHTEMRRNDQYGDKKYKVFAGTILSIDEAETSNENPMWFVRVITDDDVHEFAMFEWRHEHVGGYLQKDRPMLIVAAADTEGDYAGEYSIQGLIPMRQAINEVVNLVAVNANSDASAKQALSLLSSLPEGDTEVWVKSGNEVVSLQTSVKMDYGFLKTLQRLGTVDVY